MKLSHNLIKNITSLGNSGYATSIVIDTDTETYSAFNLSFVWNDSSEPPLMDASLVSCHQVNGADAMQYHVQLD